MIELNSIGTDSMREYGGRLWFVANALTGARLLAGPACFFLLQCGDVFYLKVALILGIFAEISDAADGYAARSLGSVSRVGKLLDPLADSLYRSSLFLAFAASGWLPTWCLCVILGRDLLVAGLREFSEAHIGTLGARFSGKLKAFVQGAAQLLVLALLVIYSGEVSVWLRDVFECVLVLAALVTAYSALDYVWSVCKALRR